MVKEVDDGRLMTWHRGIVLVPRKVKQGEIDVGSTIEDQYGGDGVHQVGSSKD